MISLIFLLSVFNGQIGMDSDYALYKRLREHHFSDVHQTDTSGETKEQNMPELKCPLCGSNSFYTKDPADPYEIYEFNLTDGKIVFDSEVEESALPEVDGETETFCNRCAWHDKLKTLGS